MKKSIAFIIVLLLAVSMAASAAAEVKTEVEGNVFKVTTVEDFNAGTLEGLVIDESIGDGALKLAEGQTDGVFTSAEYCVEAFEYLVASWNSDTPDGTKIEVKVRAYVDMKDAWSGWMSWGEWSKSVKRASTEDSDDLAYIDVDTFIVKGSSGETASKVQIMVVMHTNDAAVTPTVRQLAVSYKNTLDGQAIAPVYIEETVELPEKVLLYSPAYAQGIRENSMASSMCSAVTICVLLNDKGEDLMPEEVALLDYDSVYDGFGNWSYSVAAAAEYGYESYVAYANLDFLRQELAKGYPVGISVKYNTNEASNNYLENAPLSTDGHLIAIVGYETIDGVDYFYSNDSAAATDEECCHRLYRADQLEKCWTSKVAYVVHDKESGAAESSVQHIACQLVADETEANKYSLVTENGEPVKLIANFIAGRYRAVGGGIIAYYYPDEGAKDMPHNVVVTSANYRISYNPSVDDEGRLNLDPSKLVKDGNEDTTINFVIICNNGKTYEATHFIPAGTYVKATTEPTEAPAEPTADPNAKEQSEVTEQPLATDEAVTETKPQAHSKTTLWVCIGIAAAVAAAAIIGGAVVKKKK
ncbi:MAG TPA: C39 family peptidase [Eubacteriales bacterium]|nr:C39 family peptidase [Clostridia bacterium]HRV73110.1 C39 family peptidase [Eubacteriales bacterium]